MNYLEFIETKAFSGLRKELMEDDEFQELQSYLLEFQELQSYLLEFQELQSYLLESHERGDTISHTGGCKKIRWSRQGMGKRGGVRIIYYVRLASGRLYLLLIYPKNAKDDLSEKEKAVLKTLSQKLI